ncbi:MAG: peptide ABC transporter substrate-binding protein [Chloroflexi bacterium]|nr:peptide ABC transporter substrate-binding protein [Chloroflexota bacterium]
MIRYKKISLFVLVLFTIAILTACIGAPGFNPLGQTGASGKGSPAQGGVLRLSGMEPQTLDPSVVGDVGSFQFIGQIFSGLVTLDDKLEVVPDIATRWDVSPDGMTYTFSLRSDVKFHDGTPVTARDFKYSLERTTDPRTRSQVAATYLGDIVGTYEKIAGGAAEISGVQVEDDYTLVLQIDAPKTYFLSKLTYPTAFVMDRSNVETGRNWWERPNGTGPFKLKNWVKDDSIVLARNDLYYGKKPNLDEVNVYVGGGPPVTMYERGELDVVDVGLADIERVTDRTSALNKELSVQPELSLSYIGFNNNMKPFDDPKVRVAFHYATDKDKIANVLFKKTRSKANGILPPGMPGYNKDLKGIPFDSQRAKALLAESSYGGPDGLPEIVLTVSAGGSSIGESFAEMYKRNLGVDVNVQQVDEGFFDDLEAGAYQMFFTGWIADYPDPQDFLDVLFDSQSNGNYTGFSDVEVDRLLDAARVESDHDSRMELYRQAESLIVELSPAVPMYHDVAYTLTKPYVAGFARSPLGIMLLRDVEIQR